MALDYFRTLPPSDKERYRTKLAMAELQECPYQITRVFWKDDPTEWPHVEYPDIYEYLIDTPGVHSKEAMRNRKSLEAYNQFSSGWVRTVYSVKPQPTKIVLKADVLPSQRLNEVPHHPWVAINMDGSVICAHCDCMAGLGETCSHIAALLFKVEAAVRLGYTDKACTEVPCKWNNDFVKKIKAAKLRDIKFYTKASHNRPPGRNFPISTDENQKLVLNMLNSEKSDEKLSVCLSLFQNYSKPFQHATNIPELCKLPPNMRNFYIPDCTEINFDMQTKKLFDISLSSKQIEFVEKSTKLQCDAIVWHELRIGRITASVAYDVLHTSQTCPSFSVMKSICFPDQYSKQSAAMKWGTQKEKFALDHYIGMIKDNHNKLSVVKSGLRLSKDYHFLGASADAVACCECHGKWLIEIKCPFKHRNANNLSELLCDKDFCLDNTLKLKQKHRYMTQTQMQMYIYEVPECHLVCWTPNVCSSVHVRRSKYFQEDVTKMVTFYKEAIVPELLTRKIEKSVQISPVEKDPINVYCYCQTPYNASEKMIGCDNPNCTYKWIHYSCAKIKRSPKGIWFCKDCNKE